MVRRYDSTQAGLTSNLVQSFNTSFEIIIFSLISSNISAEQKWTLIGDVIGNNDNVSTGKSTFGGKEYDYVFNIDIGDGIPPLKLPFNNDQDPYTVAQVLL